MVHPVCLREYFVVENLVFSNLLIYYLGYKKSLTYCLALLLWLTCAISQWLPWFIRLWEALWNILHILQKI